jgi:hypothetical protein
MTPPLAALLLELSHRGVAVFPEGDRLRFRTRSALTADLLARIQTHRAEILALLAAHPLEAFLRAGALPTRDEWRVLAALAHGASLTPPATPRRHPPYPSCPHASPLPSPWRREVIAYTSGHVRALVN